MNDPESKPIMAPAAQTRGLWADVRAAVLGTQRSFTEGSLGRAIAILAVPMVLEMSMESLFAVCDVFFVARLGSGAVAVVGLTESVLTLLYGVAIGLSMATAAMVARRIGEGDRQGAAIAAVQSIIIGLGFSLVIGIAGALSARTALRLMGATEEMVMMGWGYTAVMLGTSASILLLFLINGVFRGAGDAPLAMRALWLANLINITLDPCLIFGLGPFPELGITGAAVATSIGRGTGVLYQLHVLLRGSGRVRVRPADIRIAPAVMLRLLRVSATGILQLIIATSSWIGLVRIVAAFGAASVAGYTIAVRIIIFALLPSWGLSNAAATLVGQNLGAGKPGRAERSVWLTSACNMVFLGAVAVVFILFAEPVIRIFTNDPTVIPGGADCLRYISYGYVFYALGMVVMQAFNGAGDTVTPTVVNLFCYWFLQIPLAWTLAHPAGLGANGVYLAIAISESILAVTGTVLFRRGRWKQSMI